MYLILILAAKAAQYGKSAPGHNLLWEIAENYSQYNSSSILSLLGLKIRIGKKWYILSEYVCWEHLSCFLKLGKNWQIEQKLTNFTCLTCFALIFTFFFICCGME